MPLQNDKVLITGTKSGLGKYLSKQFTECFCLNRENKQDVIDKALQIQLIVHCAFNTKQDANTYQLLKDNIFLTEQLCNLSLSRFFDNKFVYISSVDVHDKKKTNYNTMKLYAESIVKNHCNNYLILRCPALLGADMRKNNFLKIVEDKNPKLSLTKESSFNFITHHDILRIIRYAYNNNISGTYDVVSHENITLEQVASMCKKSCSFGEYTYNTPNVTNQKLLADFDFMNKSSVQVVQKFIKEHYG